MTEFNQRAVQSSHEDQTQVDGASAATPVTKPITSPPRSLSKPHARKSVRPANGDPQPTARAPGTPSQQRDRKITRAAIPDAKPTDDAPPDLSSKRSRKAVRPAIYLAKPKDLPPGTSSTKRGRHCGSETRPPPATARPAKSETKPIGAVPGDSLSGDHSRADAQAAHVSARRSKFLTKPKTDSSGVNSEGHFCIENQKSNALKGRASKNTKPTIRSPDPSLRDGHAQDETRSPLAVAGDDQPSADTHGSNVIAEIQELWRRRQSWHRAEKSLTLQAKAVCRRYVGGDKGDADKLFATVAGQEKNADASTYSSVAVAILPFLMARADIEKHRVAVEKHLAKLAKTLPIYAWIEPIPGIAAGSLAALVGECGDIGSYKSASALWKRMGLAVIQGGRQRRIAGVDAVEHGYSPQRRSVMWNIGGGLIGGMGKGPRPTVGEDIQTRGDWSPYQKQFVRMLREEVERVTDTWNGPEHKREPVERKGETYESFSAHAAARIKRRIEKQFLAELYGAWRDANKPSSTERNGEK